MKGQKDGVITDLDGNFKLNVSAKGSLKISFIGYQTQTIPVAGKKQFDITLKEDAKVLDEVVVVGYGQMKRSDLTGSVVSVNDEAIKKSVVTSVDQVLQGHAAGMSVAAVASRTNQAWKAVRQNHRFTCSQTAADCLGFAHLRGKIRQSQSGRTTLGACGYGKAP